MEEIQVDNYLLVTGIGKEIANEHITKYLECWNTVVFSDKNKYNCHYSRVKWKKRRKGVH